MTLPASFPLSMSQIATELGLSLPLSINNAWVLLLSGKGALPVSFSDLLGKSGRFDGASNIQEADSFDYFAPLPNVQFFGSALTSIDESSANGLSVFTQRGSLAAHNPSKILVKDNTTGQSAVLSQVPGTGTLTVALQWNVKPGSIGIFGNAGQSHSFTILPSN